MPNYKQMIKAEAKRLGFAYCGFSKAEFLEEQAPLLEQWLQQNRHGEMYFMQENFDKRLDPRLGFFEIRIDNIVTFGFAFFK